MMHRRILGVRNVSHVVRTHRHPELEAAWTARQVTVVPRLDVEADERYRRCAHVLRNKRVKRCMDCMYEFCVLRVDGSLLHSYAARYRFCQNVARGEPGMQLAEAALLIAAEDDAIGGHLFSLS